MPVCGSYGARDTGIPADSVREFAAALHVPNDIKIYDDAGHAFFDDQRAVVRRFGRRRRVDAHACVLRKVPRTAERVIESSRRLALFLFGAAIGAAIAWLAARAESAALRATLHESSRSGEKAIEALLERAKNELREATALRASERVGELVSPVAQKLVEFDRLINEIEATRRRDEGSLREQLDQLLGRTDKLESATVTSDARRRRRSLPPYAIPLRAASGVRCSCATSSRRPGCSRTATSPSSRRSRWKRRACGPT